MGGGCGDSQGADGVDAAPAAPGGGVGGHTSTRTLAASHRPSQRHLPPAAAGRSAAARLQGESALPDSLGWLRSPGPGPWRPARNRKMLEQVPHGLISSTSSLNASIPGDTHAARARVPKNTFRVFLVTGLEGAVGPSHSLRLPPCCRGVRHAQEHADPATLAAALRRHLPRPQGCEPHCSVHRRQAARFPTTSGVGQSCGSGGRGPVS